MNFVNPERGRYQVDGIADHLQHGPKTVEELAQTVGAHPGALYRLLRGIASVGVFAEEAPGRFSLTPLAALLLTHTPHSWRAAAMMNGEPWMWQPWGDLLYSVKTGRPAFDHLFGIGFDAYLAQHQLPNEWDYFDPAKADEKRECGLHAAWGKTAASNSEFGVRSS